MSNRAGVNIRVREVPITFASTRQAEESGISIIHQELNLVEELSAAANIFLGRELHNRFGWIDNRAMEASAKKLLTELECLVPPSQLVGTLRVGDQQLIEIAKALGVSRRTVIRYLNVG